MPKSKTAPFAVGDLVRTAYSAGAERVVRRVVLVREGNSQSGWLVAADAGDPCPHCGMSSAPTRELDSSWFEVVNG